MPWDLISYWALLSGFLTVIFVGISALLWYALRG